MALDGQHMAHSHEVGDEELRNQGVYRVHDGLFDHHVEVLTSSVLCQYEDRVHSQVYILIHEYRIEDPLNACSSKAVSMGSCET